jgi:hypothetical protein
MWQYFPSTALRLPRNHCLFVRFPAFAGLSFW